MTKYIKDRNVKLRIKEAGKQIKKSAVALLINILDREVEKYILAVINKTGKSKRIIDADVSI